MKRNKRLIIPLLILLGGLVFLCVHFYQNSAQKEKNISILYIPKNIDQNNDFWTTLILGARMAASEYDIHLVIDAPATETDYEIQNQMIESAITKQVDVLAVSPIDTELSAESIKKVQDAGIPVVFVDSTVNDIAAECIVATDNFAAGKSMGTYIKSLMKEDSKIAIVAHVKDSSTAIDREAGLRDSLGDEQNRIVETVFCDSDFTKSYELTKDLLSKYPDISIIAGLNEYSAVGAGKALRELNLKNQVSIVGFDNSIASVEFLEEGIFQGLIIQNAFNMGYLGIESAYKIASGQSVNDFIDSGSELITRDTMYTEESQKLLFSFLNE